MADSEFWDSVRLKKEILKHIENETFVLTRHAAEEQANDDLDLIDTLHVLRYGVADPKHTGFYNKTQSWRYGVKGSTEDAKNVIVIVSFNGKMMIITVFKVGKNK
jgi:Domain of unknown function (DUF4258)